MAKRGYEYIILAILAGVAVFAWSEVFGLEARKLNFYALDVGQGDAIFIETPTKNQILIDGGPDKSVLEELGEVMPPYDRSIDIIMLTHPNLDHAAGLVDVLKNYDVKYLIDTDDEYHLSEYKEIKKLIDKLTAILKTPCSSLALAK